MTIKNGLVFRPGEGFVPEDIHIAQDRIVSEKTGDEVLDAQGTYVIPGLTDIHFHGCMGCDVCDGTPEALEVIGRRQASQGVTGMCPATMTLPEDTLRGILENAGSFSPSPESAVLCGIQLEGPFLSHGKKGAQNGKFLQGPDAAMYHRLQAAAKGCIKLVDVAPELPGAMDFIREAAKETRVSIAHTAADYSTAAEAFRRGASHVTHFYNAMTGFGHREPGVVGAAFADPNCMVELICDGIHVHPAAVQTALKVFGEDRVCFVSDSIRAAGMGDGTYDLGRQQVRVEGRRAVLSDGTIAGSCTELMDCLRTAVRDMDVPLELAVTCAAVNPAKAIGVYDHRGSLDPGKAADVVLLRPDLEIAAVILRGKVLAKTA